MKSKSPQYKANLKTYTVTLNPDETEFIKEHFKKSGMTLSAFFRAAIHELKDTLEVGEKKKSFKDMSASEFLDAVDEMKKKLKDE